MHFVPFANGCAPPVLDKEAIKYDLILWYFTYKPEKHL